MSKAIQSASDEELDGLCHELRAYDTGGEYESIDLLMAKAAATIERLASGQAQTAGVEVVVVPKAAYDLIKYRYPYTCEELGLTTKIMRKEGGT